MKPHNKAIKNYSAALHWTQLKLRLLWRRYGALPVKKRWHQAQHFSLAEVIENIFTGSGSTRL